MTELVQIVQDAPRVSTNIIAEWFWIEHLQVIRLIEKYKTDLEDFWKMEEGKEKIIKLNSDFEKQYWRKVWKVYYLNEDQYIFIWTLTNNTKKSVAFKKKLVKAFSKLKKIVDWLNSHKLTDDYTQARIEWKIERKSFTDVLKELKIYALKQNPLANTNYLYSNYTKVINKNLFVVEWDFKNVRNYCNSNQLNTLRDLENKLSIIIIKEIDNNKGYKEIYSIVKEKMEAYCNLFNKTKVIWTQLTK